MSALLINIKRAAVDFLFLKLLSEQDMYGYQIVQEFRRRTNNKFTLVDGSSYPIARRLEDKGYITSYEQLCGKRQKRVYYHLTPEGAEHLQKLLGEYRDAIQLVNTILDSTDEDSHNES
jgi:PadR family transcriptional regulator PadR